MGRSQMARAFHNYYRSLEADAAGTLVKEERRGKKLGELDGIVGDVVKCMGEEGLNMLSWQVTQLQEKMIDKYDKIIVMAEPETWPDYLKNSEKVIYWEIEDPKGKGIEIHRRVRDEIKRRVENLISGVSD